MLHLSLFNFFYYWAISIISAFLPLFFRYKGMGPGEIGLLLAVGPLVTIFSQPLWGIISDKRQTIKRIVLLLLIVTLVTSFAVFYGSSIIILILAMMLFHFFMSPIQPLVDSMSTAYAQEKGVSYGSIRIWGSLGFAFASFFIGFLIGKVGIQYLWYIYGIIIIVSFIIAARLSDLKSKKARITKEALKKTFQNPRFIGFLIAALFIAIPTRMNDGMLGLYMKNLGASESQVGLAWMVSSLSEAPVIGLMYILMRRFPLLVLITISGAIYSVRWLLYAYLSDPMLLVASQTLHSVTFAIFMVCSLQYVASVVPREMLATGQTLFFATYTGLASIIGNSLGGYFMEEFGASFIYKSGAILAMIGTILCASIYLRSRKHDIDGSKATI